MADKNIKLKDGSDVLYPQTKTSNLLKGDGTKDTIYTADSLTAGTNISITQTNGVYKVNNTQDISGKLDSSVAATTYVALTQKAAANGVATLDANTKVPAGQLPTIDGGTASNA